ncbi:MAG: choice-of-anchor Q domain-containing protein [bacterium]
MKSSTLHPPPCTRHLPRGSLLPLLLASLFACTAHATEYLVVTNGNDAASGMGRWANALRTIGAAVAKATNAGDIVTVSNGTYNITNEIAITAAITVRSFGNGVTGGLANAANTIVSRGGGRWNFNLTAPAIVDGFTGMGANAAGSKGANFYVSAGATVKNCVFRNNTTGYGGSHSAGHMVSGMVSNCLIYGNTTGDRQHDPGTFSMDGGLMVACRIYNNHYVTQTDGGGVGLNGSGATLRNCLLYGNNTSGNGGGVFIGNGGGTVDSCTIIGNTAGGSGGGIYRCNGNAGTVMNCIVYNNLSRDEYKNIYNTDANVTYTCTTNPVSSGAGCVTGDPLCRDAASGNYGLSAGSSCIDKGSNQEWMNAVTDLDGKGRIFRDLVDMGAFEYWPDKPLIQNAGVTNLTSKSAMVRGNITWAGAAASTVIVYHGPSDGGTNPQDWANELRLPGLRRAGPFEATIAHSASNRVWCYRLCATNQYGASWSDFTGGLTLSKVDVSVTRRESTEEKPAAFVISRPATAGNGPLDVYFTLSGTGINGRDYDRIDSPVVIPSGAKEIRLIVTPRFNLGDQENKVVELTLATGGYTLGVQKSARILMRAE